MIKSEDEKRTIGTGTEDLSFLSSSNNNEDISDNAGCNKQKYSNGKVLREEKRRKYELKREQRAQRIELELERKLWVEVRSEFCTQLTDELLQKVPFRVDEKDESSRDGSNPNPSTNIDLDKVLKLLKPYTNLKGKSEDDGNPSIYSGFNSSRAETNYFIAEGTETVRTLIRQVDRNEGIPLISILVKPSTFFDNPVKLMEDVLSVMKSNTNNNQLSPTPRFHVFIAKESVLSKLIGFNMQRGAIACGVSRCLDETWLFDTFLPSKPKNQALRALVLDGICDTSNLGSVIRTAAATGMDFVLLSKDSCNPWSRRSVRVSMGYISAVPIVKCVKTLDQVLRDLSYRFDFITYAAVLNESAEYLESISNKKSRWCCVMGNEHCGVSKAVMTACTNKVKIRMRNSYGISVDSFSLPVATGIMLHGLVSRESYTM